MKELVIIAQDTTRYGQGTSDNLPELLRRLSNIDGVEWLRLMYAYPDTVTDELIETLLYTPKVLHYLDLPIQHADDEILLSMNRRGTSADIAHIIKKLRGGDPDFILRTSLITGFPGETEGTAAPGNGMTYAENMVACMEPFGWDVAARPDGGVEASYPVEQEEAYSANYDMCEQKFGYDVPPPPLTDSQIRDFYAKVLVTAECLVGQGYDPGEPPSEQEFIDQYYVDKKE